MKLILLVLTLLVFALPTVAAEPLTQDEGRVAPATCFDAVTGDPVDSNDGPANYAVTGDPVDGNDTPRATLGYPTDGNELPGLWLVNLYREWSVLLRGLP